MIFATVGRIFNPPPAKVHGRLTMTIPTLADTRDGRQADKVKNTCNECAKLLAAHLYRWEKKYPEKSTVKTWNVESQCFLGMDIADFQNFLMTHFSLRTADGREWLMD